MYLLRLYIHHEDKSCIYLRSQTYFFFWFLTISWSTIYLIYRFTHFVNSNNFTHLWHIFFFLFWPINVQYLYRNCCLSYYRFEKSIFKLFIFPLPFIRSLSILLVNVKCLCMYMMYESAFYYKLLTDMPECLLEFDAFYAWLILYCWCYVKNLLSKYKQILWNFVYRIRFVAPLTICFKLDMLTFFDLVLNIWLCFALIKESK